MNAKRFIPLVIGLLVAILSAFVTYSIGSWTLVKITESQQAQGATESQAFVLPDPRGGHFTVTTSYNGKDTVIMVTGGTPTVTKSLHYTDWRFNIKSLNIASTYDVEGERFGRDMLYLYDKNQGIGLPLAEEFPKSEDTFCAESRRLWSSIFHTCVDKPDTSKYAGYQAVYVNVSSEKLDSETRASIRAVQFTLDDAKFAATIWGCDGHVIMLVPIAPQHKIGIVNAVSYGGKVVASAGTSESLMAGPFYKFTLEPIQY